MIVLSDIVSVRTRYRRAVNLALDSRDVCALDDILVTPLVRSTFERLLASLENIEGERSFMLHGPYGTGKSTFALYISALFSLGARSDAQPYTVLKRTAPAVARRFAALCPPEHPWLCLPLTGRRCSIGQIVLEGLRAALDTLPDGSLCRELRQRIKDSLRTQAWRDSKRVLELVEALRKVALAYKYGGLVIIIDEAGKSLEYALQDRAGGDVYLFQMIAEYAKRVKDVPILFLTVQHQYFDNYLEFSNTLLRHEWAKVQERFEPLEFREPLSSGLQTLGEVFKYSHPLPHELRENIKIEAEELLEAGAKLPAGMTSDMFVGICQKAWPLHPSVVLVLPLIFQRLAQNERSIFSYLSSQEPHGFQEHCSRVFDKDGSFVRLYDIADYLLTNMAATLMQRPAARNLLEVLRHDIDLEILYAQVLRTAGILSALGNSPLKATESILIHLFPNGANVTEALHSLRRKELLTYRQLDGTFRLWEGGSIDIEVLLKQIHSKLRWEGQAFLELVRSFVPMRPLVPRRHSLQTGAYRSFEVEYASMITERVVRGKGRSSSDAGKVLVLLPMDNRDSLEADAKEATAGEPSLLIAIPQQIDMLRQPAVELACLSQLAKETPELYGDKLALREYNVLLADCQRRLRQSADLLLNPQPAPHGNACKWFWRGEEQKVARHVDVTRLLSDVCDFLYPDAPMIRNELISRPALSSAATSARNILLRKMLSCSEQALLGIEGFPPERSMYESVLRETGLHTRTDAGQWRLCEPTDDSSVYRVWQAIEKIIFAKQGATVPLPLLFEELVCPPYGVPEGLLPVLLLAFYLCRKSEVFLYREGSFLAQIDDAAVELMQRRPQLFAMSGVCLTGERKALVERYAAGLHVEATVPAVVAKLYTAFRYLPAITRNTTKLHSKRGKALRDCFLEARSPEKLLFEELPRAFGLASLLTDEGNAEELVTAIRESMIELTGYANAVQCECRDALLSACGLPMGIDGWNILVERAKFLSSREHHADFLNHLQWLANVNSDRTIEKFLGLLSNRSFERWGDSDVTTFKIAAQGFGELFCRSWQDYGTSFLNKEEQYCKEQVCKSLSPILLQALKYTSSRAIVEALRELLKEVESKAIREK